MDVYKLEFRFFIADQLVHHYQCHVAAKDNRQAEDCARENLIPQQLDQLKQRVEAGKARFEAEQLDNIEVRLYSAQNALEGVVIAS